MATDTERARSFASERAKRMRDLARIQRATAVELGTQLRTALERLTAALPGASDFTAWLNPQLRRSVDAVSGELGEMTGETLAAGAERAFEAGVAGVDAPIDQAARLEVPQFSIRDHLASVDRRQLEATQRFLTGKMRDVAADAARRINTELGQVMLGVQTPSDAVTAITAELEEATRGRGITIVRTELGRAYSEAGQARMAQASKRLPGLRKQWRRSGKLHSRIEHDAADGQIRDVDEAFQVGGVELMYPRDPAGPPGATINCGCQSLPYMASWAEASLLRNPGRREFTDEEIAAVPMRGELAAPATVRERIGDAPDAPVVARLAD